MKIISILAIAIVGLSLLNTSIHFKPFKVSFDVNWLYISGLVLTGIGISLIAHSDNRDRYYEGYRKGAQDMADEAVLIIDKMPKKDTAQ
ncbi:MAG TPA: hypothetical protein VF476_11695 [Chitinophagaceae bacterium]